MSVRMAIALALVVLIYLALALVAVAFFVASFLAVSGWWDALVTTMFWLIVALGLAAVVLQGFDGVERSALRAVGAKVLDPGEQPELEAMVARLAAEADIPCPRVALARSWAPNAFGRPPASACDRCRHDGASAPARWSRPRGRCCA